MATLLVRNLDDEIVAALKRRAEAHGRSVEEEHRRILRRVLMPKVPKRSFLEHLMAIPKADSDAEADAFEVDRDRAVRPPPFDEG